MPIRRKKNSKSTDIVEVKAPKEVKVKEPKLTLQKILSDRWLRLTHLYKIKDANGNEVVFKPNPEQTELFNNMSFLNIVLKARQLGMTTFIQLFMLDACLFNRNINAGVIAHNQKDAQSFFRDKIKFAYDKLPEELKNVLKATNDSAGELVFSNGSSIRVGTSMRSGTLQYLHISEYGKICSKFPEKAEEIRSGSLNTVATGQFVFIESTAEGAHGHFFELSKRAEEMQINGDYMTDMDYKFFFFAWFSCERYRLHPKNVHINTEMQDYFRDLETEYAITLDPEQKAWYVKKHAEQGDNKMVQEFPATPAEAFRGIVEGAVYGKQMRLARTQRRIIDVPYNPAYPVETFWDIGHDMTSIWFLQQIGTQSRFIDFYQEPNRELPYFANLLLQDRSQHYYKYNYGTHHFPHDMGETDYSRGDNLTRAEVARSLGLTPNVIVPRVSNLEDGIEMTRQALATCFFDRKHCEEGVISLETYRYEWNEKHEIWSQKPLHNAASHGADAFRQYAQGYRSTRYAASIGTDSPLSRSSRRRQRENQPDWRI